MTETPTSLLERLRQPDEPEAWNRFVALYTPLIYGWARHVTSQEQDAADLVQEVFLKLVRALPTFQYDRRKGFRKWLRAVTLNAWRDRRKRRGDRPVPGDHAALADVAAADDAAPFPEAEFREQLINRAITLMQTDFNPATWKAFWEQVVSGRTARDVATELGLTVGAACAAKLRVLTRLRQELHGMLE